MGLKKEKKGLNGEDFVMLIDFHAVRVYFVTIMSMYCKTQCRDMKPGYFETDSAI